MSEYYSDLIFSNIELSRIVIKYGLHLKSNSLEEIYEKIYRLFDKTKLIQYYNQVQAIKYDLNKYKYFYITYFDSHYPVLLKEIHDPPLILFYKGNIDIFCSKFTGVVGTRKPSVTSLSFTSSLVGVIRQREKQGIISGLANGIDREAMISAINLGMPLIGVMGTGFNKEYPNTNSDLYKLMKYSENTLIITETTPFEKSGKWSFPRRNRIISGISESIVIMEASNESGAMTTAYHALQQNREIIVFDDESQKCNDGGRKLIEEGAKRITKDDINSSSKLIHLSELFGESNSNISGSLAMLGKLEMEGKVKDRGGGYFEFL